MTVDAAQLLGWSQGMLWAGFAVFLRVGAMLALVPAFGEQTVPVRVRLGLAVAFSLIVLPAVAPGIGGTPDAPAPLLLFLLAEVVAGLFFGIVLRLFVVALMMAGTIAAQSTSLSQLFGGSAAGEPSPAIGHLMVSGGLALAALLGLHVRLAAYMIESYGLIPPGTFPASETVLTVGLAEVARSLSLAFTLAAPFVAGALAYNVILGVINRAMPQLMVTFIGAPVLTAGGLALMALVLPLALAVWSDALQAFLAAPFGAP